MLALSLLVGGGVPGHAAETQRPVTLTTLKFYLVGGELRASPSYQAVPKSLTTRVDLGFALPPEVAAEGITFEDLAPYLPQDLAVQAELRGPAFTAPRTLTTLPNRPLEIPTPSLPGIYMLENIRMVSGGEVVAASPSVVTIESVNEVLITKVTTRPLSLEEIRDRGIAIDAKNFTVYNFSAALAFQSNPVSIEIPIAIPGAGVEEIIEPIPQGAGGLSVFTQDTGQAGAPRVLPDPPIPNVEIKTFQLKEIEGSHQREPDFPPISGIIVIPGNIGFLHQFFEATLLVTNGAPAGSILTLRDVEARIVLPPGEDRAAGTDTAPGDDPLRVAGTAATGGVPSRSLPVKGGGFDGLYGTADDAATIGPQETGQAAFTIEGLKEGSHAIEFEITATLEGLPRGPVAISGKATGAVLVRNPNFSITLSHPATVRAGEIYRIYATVTNTSDVPANLVTLTLDPHGVSGALLLSESTVRIKTLAPRTAASVSFKLRAQVTGKVSATVFPTEEGVKGRFVLRSGVGDLGIPLLPDTLVLSGFADDLPDAVREAGVGLLGQAYSVATAPVGALPPGVRRIPRKTVDVAAQELATAGLRLFLGEPMPVTLRTLLFDLYSGDIPNAAFDDLRRRSRLSREFNAAVGAELLPALRSQGAAELQLALAEEGADRGPHLSAIAVGSGGAVPLRVEIADAAGLRLGGLGLETTVGEDTDGILREIPHADIVPLGEAGIVEAEMALLSRVAAGESYTIRWVGTAEGSADIAVVFPAADGLSQARFPGVAVRPGTLISASVSVPAGPVLSLSVDFEGDGVIDQTLPASEIVPVPDRGPVLEGAVQLFSFDDKTLDKYGRIVAAVFSRWLATEAAQDVAHYQVEDNEVLAALLQPGGRIVMLALRDPVGPYVPRALAVQGLTGVAGMPLDAGAPASVTIRSTATEPGAVVSGRLLMADGRPAAGGEVMIVYYDYDIFGSIVPVAISRQPVDADGGYRYDYVSSALSVTHIFGIRGVLPEERFGLSAEQRGVIPGGDRAEISTRERFEGERMVLDLILPGKGGVVGTVRDGQGRPLANLGIGLKSAATMAGKTLFSTYSDAQGRFSFSDVPVGGFVLSAATSTRYGFVNGFLGVAGGTITQDLVMLPLVQWPKGRVVGQVYAADGTTPMPGLPVTIVSESQIHPYRNYTVTDSAGGFAFDRVPAGRVTLASVDPATKQAGQAVTEVAGEATAAATILLNGEASIGGEVYSESGFPAAGALVVAGGRSFAYTDAEGRYRLDHLALGDVVVTATDPVTGAQGSASVRLDTVDQVASVIIRLPARQEGTLVGTVYAPDRVTPVAGAVVRVIVGVSYQGALDPIPVYGVLETTADGAGAYRLEHVPLHAASKQVIAVLSSEADALRHSRVGNAPFALVTPGQVYRADIYMVGPGMVSGTVYDAGSNNIPTGANVVLNGVGDNEAGLLEAGRLIGTTQSDAQTGRFAIGGLFPGAFSVSASNVFRPVPARVDGTIDGTGDRKEVALYLQPNAGSIRGRVFEPDGATPAGEGVRVTTLEGSPITVTTDAAGMYRFSPILPQRPYVLVAEDPVHGLKATATAGVIAGQEVTADLRLLGLGTVEVHVVAADGSPAPAASVELTRTSFPQDRFAGSLAPADAGQIVFFSVTEGPFAVEARDPNGLGGRAQGTLSGAGRTAVVQVRLAASGTVEGHFYQLDGATPIPNAQITLRSGREAIGYQTTSAEPGSAGTYSFTSVPLGAIEVEAFDPATSRKGKAFGTLASDGQRLVLDLSPVARGTVRGSVLSADGTEPVGGAPVTIVVQGLFYESFQGVTLSDGSFMFEGIPAGGFTIEARGLITGLIGTAKGSLALEGQVVAAEVRLEATGTIRGTVVRADGTTPAVGAQVQITGRATRTVQSDGAGRFEAGLLPLGGYSVTAREQNGNDGGRAPAVLSVEGEAAEVTVRFGGTGGVTGRVLESDGATVVAGAEVTLASRDLFGYTARVQTDGSGVFRFAGVPVAELGLSTRSIDGLRAASTTTALAADGQTLSIDLVMQPSGRIIGLVRAPDGVAPSPGAIVTLSGPQVYRTLQAGETGGFAFEGVPLGSYALNFQELYGAGIHRRTISLVSNGQAADLGDVVLDDQAIRVASVDPMDGQVNVPVAGAVTVRFSEPADPASVSSGTVRLLDGATAVAASVTLSADGTSATLQPAAVLRGYTRYTVVVTTGVRDRAGRALAAESRTTFLTLDNVPPRVVSASPVDGAGQVDPSAVVRIVFSEAVDPQSVTAESFMLTRGGLPVEARVDLNPSQTVAVWTPAAYLAVNATYEARLQGVRDAVGNLLAAPVVIRFATLDTIPPTVTALTLASGARLIRGNRVAVTAQTSDPDIAFVDFSIDDTLAATVTAAPYTATVALTPASGDTLALQAVATDKVGNRGPVALRFVTVQPDRPPAAQITAPAQAELGGTVSVTVSGTDDVGVTKLTLVASSEVASTQTKNFAVGESVSNTFSLQIPATVAPGGAITLSATATDTAGQVSPVAAAILTVADTTKPVVSILSPASGPFVTGSTVTVEVRATDLSGISEIRLLPSAGAVTSANPVPFPAGTTTARALFSLALDASAPVGQTVTVSAQATDASGNVGEVAAAGTARLTVIPPIPQLLDLRATAASGTPADPALPSANLGQEVTLLGTDLRADTRLRVATRNASGSLGTLDLAVVAGSVSADGGSARVSLLAGGIVVTGSARLFDPLSGELSDRAVPLQIVPTVTILAAPVFAPGQPFAVVGSAFVEDGTTARFVNTDGTSVTVTDRGPEIDVTGTNARLGLTLPEGVGSGRLEVSTEGGTATFTFTVPQLDVVAATAAVGTPADPAKPSANMGQTIVVGGADLGASVLLRVPTIGDDGVKGSADLALSNISSDGTSALVLIDPLSSATTGEVRLYNTAVGVGSARAVALQIVPTIASVAAQGFGAGQPVLITGSGFVEDGTTIRFPAAAGGEIPVADTGANAGVRDRSRTIALPSPSGVGPGQLRVTTAGGTSNGVDLGIPGGAPGSGPQALALSPDPFSVAPGAAATLTIAVAQADLFDRTVELAVANTAIAQAPASVTLPGGFASVSAQVQGVAQGATTITARIAGTDTTASVSVYVAPPFSGSGVAQAAVGVMVLRLDSLGPTVADAPAVGVQLAAIDPGVPLSALSDGVGVFVPGAGAGAGGGEAYGGPLGVAVGEAVTGLSPAQLAQGAQNVTLRITGADLYRVTQVTFEPATGITVANPPAIDADGRRMTVTISVSSGAALGPRKVVVRTAAGVIPPAAPEAATVTIVAAGMADWYKPIKNILMADLYPLPPPYPSPPWGEGRRRRGEGMIEMVPG